MKRACLAILVLALGCGKKPADEVAELVAELQNTDPGLRYSAATSLGSLAQTPEVREAAPALIRLLRDRDANVRMAAAYALANIGPDAAAALPDLVKLLADKNREVRIAALYALPAMGPGAASAMPEIQKRLRDPDAEVRLAASRAIKQMQIAQKYHQASAQ